MGATRAVVGRREIKCVAVKGCTTVISMREKNYFASEASEKNFGELYPQFWHCGGTEISKNIIITTLIKHSIKGISGKILMK